MVEGKGERDLGKRLSCFGCEKKTSLTVAAEHFTSFATKLTKNSKKTTRGTTSAIAVYLQT